jgi:hypothetical protein
MSRRNRVWKLLEREASALEQAVGETLPSQGFTLVDGDGTERSWFKRCGEDLFGGVSFDLGFIEDRPGYLLSASVSCSVAPGRMAVKPLAVSECITELGDESGFRAISGDADREAWGRRFLRLANRRVEQFADRRGPRLLQETQAMRDAASAYLSHYDPALGVPLQPRASGASLMTARFGGLKRH